MPTPMAMRFWLFRRASTANEDAFVASGGRATMSYESLEHMVRSRLRMFLRHTWLVTILGTLLFGAAVWAAIHFTMARDHLTDRRRAARCQIRARAVQPARCRSPLFAFADRSDHEPASYRRGDEQGRSRSRGSAEPT